MYKKHANAIPVIGAPTVESGVAPAIDHGTSAAMTTALFSRLMANSSLSFCDSALKRFKRSCAKAGVLAEVRKRECYESPSVKRRKKSEAARKNRNKRYY